MKCNNHIGCYPSCEPIELPFLAQETGTHVLSWIWLGQKQGLAFEATDGEPIEFVNLFNEHSTLTFRLKSPSGKYYDVDGGLSDDPINLQITIQ